MESLFSINQKVVCVDSKHPVGDTMLIEGKVYTVRGIAKRSCCGHIVIDVGIRTDHKSSRCLCGCRVEKNGRIAYKSQTRFVPLEFDRQADTEIFEALKGQKIIV